MKHTDLYANGFTVIEQVFSDEDVRHFRDHILDHQHLMKNTRPTQSARHLAGFHRFPTLEQIHHAISSNARLTDFGKALFQGEPYVTIGMSDITINRSQDWHTDLLRGPYARYLDEESCWGDGSEGLYKFLVYLQDGSSLQVARGAHLRKTPLNDYDILSSLTDHSIESVPVAAGDVVVMDIRLPHRGSSEEQTASMELGPSAKILVSTVVGRMSNRLTHQMSAGNAMRLADWDQRPAKWS